MKNQPLSATYVISGRTCYVYDPQKDQWKVCTKHLWQTEVRQSCTFAHNVEKEALYPSAFANMTWNMNGHAESGWPARALDEAREQLQRAEAQYQEEKSRMQQQITELHDLLRTLGSNITAPRTAEALCTYQCIPPPPPRA